MITNSMDALWDTVSPPTVAGGTGGSGTRVFSEVLQSAGVFMGARLNRSSDALDLADFEWRWGKPYLAAEGAHKTLPQEQMEVELQKSLRDHLGGYDAAAGAWGWKHPHAYLLLPWLDTVFSGLRFVHIVRDGRQIAFSSNQNQPRHYSDVVFGAEADGWSEHVRAIRFWGWANERAADYGEGQMGDRYLRLRFEDICDDPEAVCSNLIAFAQDGKPASDAVVAEAAALVSSPPARTARRRRMKEVEQLGLHSLRRFGYL